MTVVLVPTVSGTSSRDFSVYDAYLNDQGLIFFEDDNSKPSTRLRPLQPVRSDVGNNPDEIRPESGDMFAQSDFSHGLGQAYFHHVGADKKMYFRGEGFDISDPGRLRHLRTTAQAVASANIGKLAQAGGLPFVIDGTNIKRGDATFPGVWTNESPHVAEGAVNALDLVSAGDELYAALGANGIHTRSAGGVWSHYNNVLATRLCWAKERLMAADGRSIYEVTAGGAAPTAIETLPVGWTFECIWEAGSYIYASAINTAAGVCRINRYGLNSAGTAIIKIGSQPFPFDQIVYSGSGYLDKVYLGVGKKNSSGGYDPVLYQAAPDSTGGLAYAKLLEEQGSTSSNLGVSAILPIGEQVLFGWSLKSGSTVMAAREGLAQHNLRTDALSMHVRKVTPAATPARVIGIMRFQGRVLFAVAGDGLYYEDLSKYVSQAELVTSIADWSNSGLKVWDTVSVSHRPLPAGSGISVTVDYTAKHPDEADWLNIITSNVSGSEGLDGRLTTVKSRLFALRIRSNADSTQATTPEVIGFQVRSNSTPTKPEYLLTRFVRLLGRDRKDEQAEVITQDPDVVRRAILDLAYTWVSFYEPDASWTAWVQDVADFEPDQPLIDVTAGQPSEDVFVMRITLNGTRDA